MDARPMKKPAALKQSSGIFHAAMILLLLVIVTMLLAIGSAWASYPANHTLTYTTNRLTWDNKTNVRGDGSAELNVFSRTYQNVNTGNGDKLLAPGTSGGDSIVLRNTVNRPIRYTAIAYYIRNDARIPVSVNFDGTGLKDTTDYSLPASINESDVLRAVSGQVAAKAEQNFRFSWDWVFETENLSSDPSDTTLGNDAAAGKDEQVKVGFYIVVEDEGESDSTGKSGSTSTGKEKSRNTNPSGGTIIVTPVKTGDSSDLWLYAGLAAACFLVLILLLTGNKKDKKVRGDRDHSIERIDMKDPDDKHEKNR